MYLFEIDFEVILIGPLTFGDHFLSFVAEPGILIVVGASDHIIRVLVCFYGSTLKLSFYWCDGVSGQELW